MKPDTLRRSESLRELDTQHAAIRRLMDRCEQLADHLDAGTVDLERLTAEVVRLRLALDAHNRFEEQLLGSMLQEQDGTIEDHIGEHRTMRAQLDATETRMLRETIGMLRAHLESEEHYLVSARALHEDLVTLGRR